MIAACLLALAPLLQDPPSAPTRRGHFGFSVDDAGDVDGDGTHDVLVGAPLFPISGEESAVPHGPGRAFVFSGRSGALLRDLDAEGSETFGRIVRSAGDLDGDGKADVVVGSRAGYARVFSGADGTRLFDLVDEEQPLFGSAIAGGGDIDGDGIPDLAVGNVYARSRRSKGSKRSVGLYSGRNGLAVGRLYGEESHGRGFPGNDGFGRSMALVPDIDGDACAEIVVGSPTRGVGAASVYSGKTRELLFPLVPPKDEHLPGGYRPNEFGGTVAGAGDVNADGTGDIVVGALDRGIYLYSGKTGEYLFEVLDLHRTGYLLGFGDSIAALGDVDGDGHDDLAVGCMEGLDQGDQYYWTIVSGRDGHEIDYRFTKQKYVVVGAIEDLDRDGVKELLLGFPELDRVEVRSGRDRSLVFELGLP